MRRTICDQRPKQLKMAFRWGAAVMQLIQRESGISPTVCMVGGYPRRWGFTPQKPMKKVYEQSPVPVKK